MSAAEQWMIIRKNSCFLLKNRTETFSREKNNLKNKNRLRFNGLVHKKTIGIEEAADGKGVVMVTKKPKKENKPAQMYNRVTLSKHNRKTLKSIRRTIQFSGYRRELKMAALQRASAYLKSQKQKGQK